MYFLVTSAHTLLGLVTVHMICSVVLSKLSAGLRRICPMLPWCYHDAPLLLPWCSNNVPTMLPGCSCDAPMIIPYPYMISAVSKLFRVRLNHRLNHSLTWAEGLKIGLSNFGYNFWEAEWNNRRWLCRHVRWKISAHMAGGMSRGSCVRRRGSKDPHQPEWKLWGSFSWCLLWMSRFQHSKQ